MIQTFRSQPGGKENREKLPLRYSRSFYSFLMQDRIEVKEVLLHQTKCKVEYLAKHVVTACFVKAKPSNSIMID